MATKVGLLHLSVMIDDAMTLKDKRRVIHSFKDRIAAGHNVSVAEVDKLDSIRQSVLAVAMVGNDGNYLQGGLETIVQAARENRRWVLVDYEIELI
jgi:uncharacterized protein YlxP (DUF503 family)